MIVVYLLGAVGVPAGMGVTTESCCTKNGGVCHCSLELKASGRCCCSRKPLGSEPTPSLPAKTSPGTASHTVAVSNTGTLCESSIVPRDVNRTSTPLAPSTSSTTQKPAVANSATPRSCCGRKLPHTKTQTICDSSRSTPSPHSSHHESSGNTPRHCPAITMFGCGGNGPDGVLICGSPRLLVVSPQIVAGPPLTAQISSLDLRELPATETPETPPPECC
ncbi:MAG: hypothetical protein R3C01_05690 [Planctomycetaceae bacterium]